ncbi:hypothetical protein Tco_0775319, partial [Tanacetum coccineum]
SRDAQLLLDLKKGSKLSRREILIQEMSRGQGERLETVDEGDEDDASNYTVFVHDKEKEVREKETPITKPLSSLRTESSQDDVLRYLNEPPGPSLGDVGLTGMQERQVTMTEPTGPNQRGFIVVNPVMNLTPGETPTLGSIPGGNPELISCTSGASENASDVMAQNLNLQVQPITGVDDLIPYPPITTIITIKPTRFKRKKIMDEFIAEKVPTAVQESVSAQVINEVNNHAHILVPDVVADFIRPCLHKVVLHVHHTERISLTTTPTLSTTNITIPELKKKLYEMMPNNAKSTMLSTLLYENMCTNTNKLLQKCHTLTCRNEKVTGGE